jgi:predicted alpha/beta-fold hydrolase
MPKLDISPDFTMEDIRKVRDYDYEMTKDMTFEEQKDYYRKGAEEALQRMTELKAEKQKRLKAINE